MHEYGLPSIKNNSLLDDGKLIIDDINYDEFGMLIGGNIGDKLVSPLVRFDPCEYGAIESKYKDDKLIFSEIMSSTKVYLTKNA